MIYNIVFCPGGHGTYIAWCIYTYSELNKSGKIDLPFCPDGSCHLFRNHIGFNTFKIIHALPEPESNIVYITPLRDRAIEYLDNQLTKQSKFNNYEMFEVFLSDYKEKLHLGWGSNVPEKWQERELLSFFLPGMFEDQMSGYLNTSLDNFKNAIQINSEEIFKDLRQCLNNIFTFFNLKSIDTIEKLEEVHGMYHALQKNLNKEQITIDYANAAIVGKSFAIKNCTLFDEAWIQHLLREKGFEIKCYNLNTFPLCASKLTPLLEKIQ
ncbi:hypothetical protein UFOVP257_325 [uncultured Caudovirales phage]|uniref:Uncharacterized protein n=1 Tax=uncultured Caudovirales phage TaxID=2100421 RepID=A0A6J5LJT5_9CAUD|nr:hypothetical protein UFOVP257_325 [uncultured Caudovirales phage]